MRIEAYKKEIWECNHCSMCSEMVCDKAGYYKVCPVYQLLEFENYTARGHNTIALYILEGSLKYGKEISDIIFKCTTCLICEEVCKPMGNAVAALGGYGLKSILESVIRPMNIEMNPIPSVSIIEAMRADCVERELEPKALKDCAVKIENTGNIYGKPEKVRTKWADGLNILEGSDTILFVGDTAAYKAPEVAQAAARIFMHAGIRFGIMDDERSSGALMFRTGNLKVGEKMARHNLELLKSKGVKEIIVLSADDYYCISKDWTRICGSLPFKVRHISMVLSDMVRKGRIKPQKFLNTKVTYEDPCHLGRGMNIYEDPRIVLRSIPGLELIEMYPTAHGAWCCGNCGGLPQSDPELSIKLGERKLPLVAETGANIIATACPEVKVHMQEVIRHAGKDYQVKDVSELIAESMEV